MGFETSHKGVRYLFSRVSRAAQERWWTFLPVMFVALVGFAFIAGLLVKMLWNWLMPDVFGLATITLWQALGLLFLAKILFGLGGSHSSSSGGGDRRSRRARSDRDMHEAERDSSEEQPEQPDVDEKKTAEFERYWREQGRQAYQSWLERVLEDKKDGGDSGS